MKVYLGIDIAKLQFDVALPTGAGWDCASFPNSSAGFERLQAWIAGRAKSQIHAVMEATGTYGCALALALREMGHGVSVVNPAAIKAFAKSKLIRVKTDAVDAKLISQYGEANHPMEWIPLPDEVVALQEWVRYRESLIKQRIQLTNRADTIRNQQVQSFIRDDIDTIIRRIKEIESKIDQHISSSPELSRSSTLLQTIPGIGKTTAAAILAECPRIQAFATSRQVAAFSGLTPRIHESGRYKGQSPLCKMGNAALRKALYWPAIAAARWNVKLKPLYDRIAAQGDRGAKMRAIGAVMRKLLHLAHGVLKHQKPFDPHHGTSATIPAPAGPPRNP